ncbi:MAG: TolQ transporter [Spirochaetae bacterium HGW-Spirochaetae-1]|jgi:biopolymer transport protein ExbB|nr:MAG: TolQ transporter [Spirochaetae bacterium HGW-Spirochaetae-1]
MNPFVDYGEIVIFFALGISSIIALTVAIERFVVFRRNGAGKAGVFMERLVEMLHSRDIENALRYSDQFVPGVYQRFASYALTHYRAGRQGLGDLMDGKRIEIRVELEKHVSILSTLGNNAPFIGLLGTVLGVIKAFYGLGMLGGVGAEIVMRSISSALIATAAGLAVAVPVVIVNNYFASATRVIMQNLEYLSKEFQASYGFNNSKDPGWEGEKDL